MTLMFLQGEKCIEELQQNQAHFLPQDRYMHLDLHQMCRQPEKEKFMQGFNTKSFLLFNENVKSMFSWPV